MMETTACPRCNYTFPIALMFKLCPECGQSLSYLDAHGQPINRAYNATRLAQRGTDELIGLAKMAVFDGVVKQDEAEFILRWMQENAEVSQYWPGHILYQRLGEMLNDGHLDPCEQRELLDLLLDMTGMQLEQSSARNRSTTLPINHPLPKIAFNRSTFCFTGRFVYGTRRCCQDAVAALGGVAIDGITKSLDYLVIGEIGSTDWLHSTHGTKIQKAVDYREQGTGLAIIPEEHWVASLQMSL